MGSTDRILAENRAAELCRSLCQLLGPGHLATSRTLHDLAILCDAEGRIEEARALWAEARSLLESDPAHIGFAGNDAPPRATGHLL